MASWLSKRTMYVTAYLIHKDGGASSHRGMSEVVQASRGSGNMFFAWAVDVRACAECDIDLSMMDEYYLSGASGYQRVPHGLSPVLRRFWRNMRQRKLTAQGESIVNAVYEDGYLF